MSEPEGQSQAVTSLLSRASAGDATATNELFPLVYDELKAIASAQLSKERPGHTLQATALVNEAYLRLVGPSDRGWENRAHFFGAAARAIRRILTDHARGRNRVKRGGGDAPLSLDESLVSAPGRSLDLVALDEALEELAAMDEPKARLVELRFFAGLSVEDAAAALGISPRTAAREWEFARVWLHREVSKGDKDGAGESAP